MSRISSILNLSFTALFLSACASIEPYAGKVEILTTARSQALTGAECKVQTGAGKWTVTTPGVAVVGNPSGDLRVVCNKPGYRTSEVVHRASGGITASPRVGVGIGAGSGGGVGLSLGMGFPLKEGRREYPTQVVVDMTPL